MTTTHIRSAFLAALLIGSQIASPVAAAEVLDSGTWTTKNYEISGGWRIVADGDGQFVELDEAFRTREAPDLKLFLSMQPLSELSDRNALHNAVRIAPLEAHQGEGRYAVPSDVDLARFQTLFIHCERYSKLWGGAKIAVDQ